MPCTQMYWEKSSKGCQYYVHPTRGDPTDNTVAATDLQLQPMKLHIKTLPEDHMTDNHSFQCR